MLAMPFGRKRSFVDLMYRNRTPLISYVYLLLSIIALTLNTVSADEVTATVNGQSQTFSDVKVMSVQRSESSLSFNVEFQDGQVYPLDLQQTQSIRFGDNGGGAYFDMTTSGGGNNYMELQDVHVLEYRQGYINAKKRNEQTYSGIAMSTVLSFDRDAEGFPGASGGTEEDFFSSGESSNYSEDYSGDDSFDYSGESDFSIGSSAAETDKTVILIATILQYFWIALTLTSHIWLIIYLFGEEDTQGAVLLILSFFCGCLYPLKFYYGLNYRGAGRGIMLTLIITELLILLSLIAIVVIFGAAMVALVGSM